MTKRVSITFIGALVLSLCVQSLPAADKAEREAFDHRLQEANKEAKKSGMTKPAIHTVAVETGVPESEVEAMHKKNPDYGIASLMMACVLADETKLTAESLIQQHKAGKSWLKIAEEHHVKSDKLTVRLDHFENALKAGEKPRDERKR
jgi:PBP1b-binding outer membrane lipoprotein LpoB